MKMRHKSETVSTGQRLVQAADACIQRSGLAATTVEDVATEAGLSRSTFYRHFPDLDAVVIRLAVEEGRQQLEAAVASVADEATCAQKLTGIALFMITRGMERPSIKALMTGPGALETVNAVLNDADALGAISSPLHPVLAWGAEREELRTDLTFDEIAEWLLRNVWSLNIAPVQGGWTEERLRTYVRDFVIPGVMTARVSIQAESVHRLVGEARRALDRVDHYLRKRDD